MNKVMLMGRLTRDPEIRYTNGQNGQMAIARFSLAVDRRGAKRDGNAQTADFISCVAFGHQGEFAEKYLKKGSQIIAIGRIQTGSYDKNGTKVYTTDVIVEEFEFCGSKNDSGTAQNSGQQAYNNQSRPTPTSTSGEDFMNIPESADDDSLPFH